MRRSLAIRIILAVTLMEIWIILSHLDPGSIFKLVALLGAMIISSPLHRLREKKKRNLSFQIAFGLAAVSLFGLIFWHLQLLDRRGLDIPTAIFFGLFIVAQGFYIWSLVVDSSDQKLQKLFGHTLSHEDQDHLQYLNNLDRQEDHSNQNKKTAEQGVASNP